MVGGLEAVGIGDWEDHQQATATVRWEGEMMGNHMGAVRIGLGGNGEPRNILEVQASGPKKIETE